MGQRRQNFLINTGISLSIVSTPFTVAQNNMGHKKTPQHLRGNFSRKGATLLRMHILRPELKRMPLQRPTHTFQGGKGRTQHDIDRSFPTKRRDQFAG